ncbi:MAG: 16S rRNA (cytosine(1402)-N(4))-methyltransferase RsmH, partial [Prevotellaceae bacterium]|nr:16S rRNA (cytosine(1402)-N(4))-methyltransferase RsmH [Prevotellaceae bacterium]
MSTEQLSTCYHVPVLLQESVDGLDIKPDGTYVDVTFGGGGHAQEILRRLGSKGRLIALDQDAAAAGNAERIGDRRLTLVRGNFRFVRGLLRYHAAEQVDGLLGDLGVSWHQLDTGERGFSFRFDAPLDMRMNEQSSLTAAAVVGTYSARELSRIFADYGELSSAYKLAKAVEEARKSSPIATVGEFLEVVRPLLPRLDEHKQLPRVFQALRIEVNQEM